MKKKLYSYSYPRPAVTVDAVVLGKKEARLFILLIQRKNEPFKGMWALPGGFIEMDERLEEAVRRELIEETGLTIEHLSFVGIYDTPDRDPRGRTISAVYLTFTEVNSQTPHPGDDAENAGWFGLDELPLLAFDHEQIICDVKTKIRYGAND
jgi:8-oxo-dGTP diphosphatase